MIENLSDYDEELDGKIFERSIALSQQEIMEVDPEGSRLNLRVVPVLCGSAFKNKGVQMLLDAVVDFLPSPVGYAPRNGKDKKGEEMGSVRQ